MIWLLWLLLVLVAPSLANATTWYVRPGDDGNGTDLNYGVEDGTSAANAFDGFADITGIAAGDTVCLPGSEEPFFERLAVGTAGSAGLPVTYKGCGTTPALIWYALGLSGTRSFDSARALITTAPYAWETVSTDLYKKRIDVRPRVLWEDSTWLTPINCNAVTEAAVISQLTAGQWCVRDNGDSTYRIYYKATATAKNPTTTVIRSEYVPFSDGSTTGIVITTLDWQVFQNIEVRGVSASASSRSLYINNASNIILDTMYFTRNKEGPSVIPSSVPMTDITWRNVIVTDSCETGSFISPILGLTRFTVTDSTFSRSAGSCYNGNNFTAGDGDGFAVGQGGGTVTQLVVQRIRTDGNFNAGVFIGTVNAMTVTDVYIQGLFADSNLRNCYSEGTTSQIVGVFIMSGVLCTNTVGTGATDPAIGFGGAPPSTRNSTIANITFAKNRNFARLQFRPHANHNYLFYNLVFTQGAATGDTRDLYSSEIALVGDEVFKNIYFYDKPNQASRFAKLGSTSYYYSAGGDPAAFVTATGGTGINVNVDPQVLSTTDFRSTISSPLRRTGNPWGALCSDARGRACLHPPDIGAYQASSGDPATTRSVRP